MAHTARSDPRWHRGDSSGILRPRFGVISFPLNGLDGFGNSGAASVGEPEGSGSSDTQDLDALRRAESHAAPEDDIRALAALARAGNVQALLGILEVLTACVPDRAVVKRVRRLERILSDLIDASPA